MIDSKGDFLPCYISRKGKDRNMMYTELFSFEGASATDAAPCYKAAKKQRQKPSGGMHGKTAGRPLFLTGRDAVIAILSRRTARIR